jgi:tetratricopeptide (TPR) repeat protein
MQLRNGLVEESLAEFDRAEELIEFAEPIDAYRLELNRGTTQLWQGKLAEARADLAAAVAIAEANSWPVERAKARHNLGYVEFLSGNLAAALRIMDEVRDQEAGLSLAVVLLDRARVLIEAGLHRDADDSLREAHSLFRAARLWNDVSEVELARAECALLDDQVQAARRLAGSARTRFRRRVNDRWRREAELVLLHADLAGGRPGGRLAGPALRLADEFRRAHLPARERTARLIAAEALLRARRTNEAYEAAAAAGPIRPNDPISERLQTHLVHAKLHAAERDSRAARREIDAGLTQLFRHQAQFGSLDLQTAGAVHGRELAGLYVDLALAEGDPHDVLVAVERTRAVTMRIPSVTAPNDPGVASLLAELRQLTEQQRVLDLGTDTAGAARESRQRVARIQRELRERSWLADGIGGPAAPASIDALTAALSRQAATFVSLFHARGQLHAVVVGRGRARLVPLAAMSEVEEAARRLRAALDVLAPGNLNGALLTAVQNSLQRSLELLDRLIIAPLNADDSMLILSPPGALLAIPWNLLPSLRGRPVIVNTSATAWIRASTAANTSGPARVVAVAGPELSHADYEAQSVARHWPNSTVVHGQTARRQDLEWALGAATVVHVAAHGRHDADNPLFSTIRLSDGVVYAYELRNDQRLAPHVILSACELGQATIRAGDEAVGLTGVLLRLGARCVVASVAKVHDEHAAATMSSYHESLAKGADTAHALARATESGNEMPSPFVCFGTALGIGSDQPASA